MACKFNGSKVHLTYLKDKYTLLFIEIIPPDIAMGLENIRFRELTCGDRIL